MVYSKFKGLIAATYTPLHEDGGLNLDVVPQLTEHLIDSGVAGLYVCGSTGEGVSLSSDERRSVAEAYVEAASGRLPVVVQVGHNSIAESRLLASHAAQIGAAAISANAPSYFKITDVRTLIDCMSEIAVAAPTLPFYYYHIPMLTGAAVDMVAFLKQAGTAIPNLAGIKYTDSRIDEYQACLAFEDGRYDILWGLDEMLLGALAVGAQAAIGSTYNIAAPHYLKIMQAFEDGDIKSARQMQLLAINMIRTIVQYPLHPAIKSILGMRGLACGPCRQPQRPISETQVNNLRRELESLDFFNWSTNETAALKR
jgi:N-acetylneuraminate lyase